MNYENNDKTLLVTCGIDDRPRFYLFIFVYPFCKFGTKQWYFCKHEQFTLIDLLPIKTKQLFEIFKDESIILDLYLDVKNLENLPHFYFSQIF